uniref:Large ribosomal subunit protein mL46 N-terminal domain-containing protein n=1 Tax=Ciona savignyi TaxID=51511 RepID=H2Y6P3_CIOSA
MNVSSCAAILHRSLSVGLLNSTKGVAIRQSLRGLTHQPNKLCDIDAEARTANREPSPWKICAAVCQIRLPIQTRELSDIEKKYAELTNTLEYERSVLSDWEVEKNRQAELIRDIESGEKNPEEMDFKVSNQDLEEMCETELQQFQESNEILTTEDADLTNLSRKPTETLVLTTQQKLGNDNVWMLPMEGWVENETLRQCAERALLTHCGPDLVAQFISNGPSGFYKYKFPKEARENSLVGAKLFIYNAYLPRIFETEAKFHFQANLDENKILQHAWLSREELKSYVKPKFTNVIQKIM